MNKLLATLLLLASVNATGQQTDTNRTAFARDNMNAVLWQQRAAEYRALSYQAYNIARLRLDEALRRKSGKPRCVVTDIDETVLDNSPFQGYELHNAVGYAAADWKKWTDKAVADTLPGALSFLKYAASRKVEVFYITNRSRAELESTMKNLRHYGFPNADAAHVLVKDSTSGKAARRSYVAERYNIVLLCGDNLNDLADVFYLKDQASRNAAADSLRNEFGKRFIVLPNPMYGDWEAPIYEYKKQLTEQEKAERRMEMIKGF